MKVKEESEKAGIKLNIQKIKIVASSPITWWQIDGGKKWKQWQIYFLGLQNHYGWQLQPWNQKMLASWKESYDKPKQCITKQRHHFADQGPYSKGCGLSSSRVRIWQLDHKESRVLKNWCFQALESPLDKEIKPVHPKGNQSWIFIGRTDVEAETPMFWPPDVKSWLIWKDPDVGKDWRQEEKGMTEDEMVGWHNRFNGHEFG